MPDEKLSLPELAALIVLMREAREISNPELKERYGLTLVNPERQHLNDLKLVDSWKQGRAFAHVLTDSGWARLSEEFRTGIARPAGSPGAALYALLGGLQTFMDRTGHALADIFAEQTEPAPADEPATPPDGADIEARIRAAYATLARRPGTWVGLAEVRSLLRDVPRADVDGALRRLFLTNGVNLIPESNQKTLTPQDRDAAVIIGDQDKHLLWIGA
ncbi:hypothetical protein GCM10022226_21330 [Sphaerisporangium flaviroseum]|uniref:MarR family transcriptional regulator n=1 Tax=Sphaerisporangium flaviroseum TaxID=509199 RepID=A0ABP7HPS4_9ACTN